MRSAVAICWFLATAPALLFVPGCNNRTGTTYKRAVANAVATEPHVRAFERVFPNSYHFISYYTQEKGQSCWNSKAGLHGRYVLKMQFDIAIDRSGERVSAIGPARYLLVELASVIQSQSGQTEEIQYIAGSQREFGEKEWKVLQASGGDLSVLGIEVKKNQPVSNFATAWKDG